jgi:methyltransferase (TIGR00027 family)
MREGHASFTAAAVSAARGIAGVDACAASMVEGPLGGLLRASSLPFARGLVNAASLGLVDHLELRTRAIDEAVRAAVEAGARQLVVLGAGLDARAWRMDGLSDVVVFEVDHPATQRYKRARVADLACRAREMRFVPIDFERESLEGVLSDAGHQPDVRTAWVWEGVTPYLQREAVQGTLGTVARRSSPGSRLAVTYAPPDAVPSLSSFFGVALLGFRLIGEPIVGLIPTRSMHGEMEAVGLRVREDTAPADWARAFGSSKRRLLFLDERLAVGER